jgi:hypothetical protein
LQFFGKLDDAIPQGTALPDVSRFQTQAKE